MGVAASAYTERIARAELRHTGGVARGASAGPTKLHRQPCSHPTTNHPEYYVFQSSFQKTGSMVHV